jgi:hypothetical protein
MNGGVEHAAEVGALDRTAVHADSDEATRKLVHDHEHPVAPEHDGLAAKKSTLHTLSVVCPMNDNHVGPVSRGAERWCVDSTRYTTFLSMSTPNVCEMMRAIRGQPNRGLRDLSSTMAWMSASLGPFGPAFLGQGLDENSRLTCDAPAPDETTGASRGVHRWRPFGFVRTEEERPESAE